MSTAATTATTAGTLVSATSVGVSFVVLYMYRDSSESRREMLDVAFAQTAVVAQRPWEWGLVGEAAGILVGHTRAARLRLSGRHALRVCGQVVRRGVVCCGSAPARAGYVAGFTAIVGK